MNKKITVALSSILLAMYPAVALAAINLKTIIDNLMNMVVWPIFIGAIVIMTIWAAILFITANGDPGKIATAKKAVLWVIIGIIVGLAAFSAERLVRQVIGLSQGGGGSGDGTPK
jgi:4-amino-4-deoxy-L-arabinose transferase-like glycosyltransferase